MTEKKKSGAAVQILGAVLCVADKDGFLYLYTIEGNSGGRVALNCYPKNDPRIMGYGVLNWKTE